MKFRAITSVAFLATASCASVPPRIDDHSLPPLNDAQKTKLHALEEVVAYQYSEWRNNVQREMNLRPDSNPVREQAERDAAGKNSEMSFARLWVSVADLELAKAEIIYPTHSVQIDEYQRSVLDARKRLADLTVSHNVSLLEASK